MPHGRRDPVSEVYGPSHLETMLGGLGDVVRTARAQPSRSLPENALHDAVGMVPTLGDVRGVVDLLRALATSPEARASLGEALGGAARNVFERPVDAVTGLARAAYRHPVQAASIGRGLAGAYGNAAPVVANEAGAVRAILPPAGLGSLAEALKPRKGGYALRGPMTRRVEQAYAKGEGVPADWVSPEIRTAAGTAENELLWHRAMGATSPKTRVQPNTMDALQVMLWALEHPGQSMTLDDARRLGMLWVGAKVPSINLALSGQPVSGMKTNAFAELMAGKPRIPLDTHALYTMGSPTDDFNAQISPLRKMMTEREGLPYRGSLNDQDIYNRAEGSFAHALGEVAPGVPIQQSFPQAWEGARFLRGWKQSSGGPIDILHRLTRSAGVGETLPPGALQDPELLRILLRAGGRSQ